MYELPDDFDADLLSGCYLEMVSFGICMTRLDFSRPQLVPGVAPYGVSVGIEGGLVYAVGSVTGRREFSNSMSSAPLLDFLLKDVALVERLENSTLKIVFGSGDAIVVEGDNNGGFESYTISLNSGEMIVV